MSEILIVVYSNSNEQLSSWLKDEAMLLKAYKFGEVNGRNLNNYNRKVISKDVRAHLSGKAVKMNKPAKEERFKYSFNGFEYEK